MTMFREFREINDNEGEIWRYWLQVEGNEDELDKLADLIDKYEDDEYEDNPYVLGNEDIPESDVDILVRHTMSGYMSYENKVVGKLNCPEELESKLYKGGIRDLFTVGGE